MRQIRQRRPLEENGTMNLLMVSRTAILISPKPKRVHGALNGIINGYYWRGRFCRKRFQDDMKKFMADHMRRKALIQRMVKARIRKDK